MERWRTELWRKTVHIGFGGCALLLRWLTPLQAAMLAFLALLFNLLLLHRLTGGSLLRRQERAAGFSRGVALYPAVVLILILVFHTRLELAAAVWGLVALGDGMATVGGVLVGGRRLPWNRNKTWAGLAAFVLWGTAASAFLLRWTQGAVLAAAERGAAVPRWIGDAFLYGGAGGAAVPQSFALIVGCFAAAILAAWAESLETGLDDNVLVPLVGGGALYAATLVEPGRLLVAGERLWEAFLWGAVINAALALAALAVRGVDRSGAVWGWALGTALYTVSGWHGLLMLALLFSLGTATTRAGLARKEALGIAQERGGRRGARNAIANVSAGLLFGFLALASPHAGVMTVAMVAAFATATCDTVSSEIGQAYGRRHYLVTSLRRVRPGTDGAVSLEGTLAGALAASLLALTARAVGMIDPPAALAVVAGAVAGATFESFLDAWTAGRIRLENELVNFANTVVGGLVALALYVALDQP